MANYHEIITRLQAGEGDTYPEIMDGGVTIMLSMKGMALHIVSIATAVKSRRQGKARLAMERLLSAADVSGIEEIKIYASPLNKATNRFRLIKFYESLGFQFEGRYINPAFDPELVRRIRKD